MNEYLARNVISSPAMRYFFEVAQAGSFRQAAESLGIAPSAVHRQVGILEEQLETSLLQRSRGRDGVRLTAAGEALLHRLTRAMLEMSTAIGEINDLRKAKRGKVRLGVTDTIAIDVVAPYLGEFSSLHPRVDVEVRVSEKAYLFTNFERVQLDVLLAYNAPTQIGLRTAREIRLPCYVVMRRDHPLAQRKVISLAECAQYPLALNDDSAVLDGIVGRIAAAAGSRPRIALTSNSYAFMREAMAFGDTISIQGAFGGRFRHRHEGLVYVPLRESLGRFSMLGVYVPASRRLSAAADLLVSGLSVALQTEESGAPARDSDRRIDDRLG